MAVQTQHSPGSLPILGPDEAGPLEPPDSSAHSIDNNNNNNSSEHTPSINQQLANNPQVQAPPHLVAPSPAHLILTHNNGPHVSLMPTLSTPPASAAIVPNRFRKLSFSDNQPIVPSPLHTELAHATDDGITPSTTTRSPLDDPEPGSPIAKRLAALQLNTVKSALAGEDDDDDEDEANTTPTSSIYTPSEAAESELSRTSYESSVLAPISEAPDSSFTSSASDPDPDTTPVVNTPKTAPLSFLGTPPRNHDEHKADRADHPTLRITRAGSSDRGSVLDEEDVATPTSSIIRSRSDSAMSSATSSKTGSHLASDERSSAGVNGTNANTSDANPSATSSAAQTAAAATTAAATSATTATPSTNLARSGSGRRLSCPTKASSPAASATKTKLRPCFRRRASAQSTSALSTTSSSDIDDGLHPQAHHRGRSVRFSPGPPQEVRTHSPVEYDRKSCTVNHRLTMEDVEEMRKMEMGLGLLEAKWAAAAACKAASAPSPASAAASKIHHPSPYSEDDDSSASSPKGCEAEIKFHSAAGVAGMRRSQRPSWEREQEWDGYDRDRGDRRWDRERTLDSRIRVDGSGPMLSPHASGAGGRLGLTRQYSAGGSNPNLAPPLGSSGLARRGTVTRTTSASVYNRADYSDSSESEYEMPYASSVRARVAGPAVGGSSSSSSSSTSEPMLGGGRAASSKSLSTWSAPMTSAPPMSSSLTSPGPATEGGAGCGAIWQPPDRCRNGYSGGWPGQHAASRRGGSSSGSSSSGPGSSVGMSASCSLPSAFGAASTSAATGASGSAGAGATNSIIARFGLNSPPPPLPGGVAAANAAAAPPLTDHYHSGWGSGSLSNHSSPGTGGGGAMSGYAPGGYVSHCGRRSPLIFPSRSGGGTGGPSNRAGPVGVGDSPIPSFKRTPPDQLEDESGHSTASASPPTPSKTASHLHGRDADRFGDGGGGTITTKTNIGGGKLSSDPGSKWMSEMDRSSPISSTLSSSSCAGSASGYDSPASEFCYESGSEYDLVG